MKYNIINYNDKKHIQKIFKKKFLEININTNFEKTENTC